MEIENENENIWGEEELYESKDVYKTISTMGFRDGKQYGNDIKRQEGFNVGFKIGEEIGKLYGNLLALIIINNIELNEKLLNYKEFDSLELFQLELNNIEQKLHEFPIEIREQYQLLKNKLQQINLLN